MYAVSRQLFVLNENLFHFFKKKKKTQKNSSPGVADSQGQHCLLCSVEFLVDNVQTFKAETKLNWVHERRDLCLREGKKKSILHI